MLWASGEHITSPENGARVLNEMRAPARVVQFWIVSW